MRTLHDALRTMHDAQDTSREPDWLKRIAKAYDRTVADFHRGLDPLDSLPDNLRNSAALKALFADAASCNSGATENRDYLDPRSGMRFLDIGCAASLVNYDLGSWPSLYYGVDVSADLVEAMRSYAAEQRLSVGGIHVAHLADLPYENEFFDIAAAIGVLEYCPFDYVISGLGELRRVLRPGARVVVDIPNPESEHLGTMLQLEECLGRRAIVHARGGFERELIKLFEIQRVEDAHVMVKYFVTREGGRGR